jgi:cell division cycle 20-like protein 1 (cofactor of APC complex)
VWNSHSTEPILKFNDHVAAVKAMAWSPHQHGLLVSGGGTADRTIRFRNTLTGATLKTVDVGSQVCNLMFSKTLNEIVSTHGYSHNEINIWKYPQMEKIATLTGHTYRVLYLAMSPDGSELLSFFGIPNKGTSGPLSELELKSRTTSRVREASRGGTPPVRPLLPRKRY